MYDGAVIDKKGLSKYFAALGRKSVKARMKALSSEERRTIARNAAKARWAKVKNKRRRHDLGGKREREETSCDLCSMFNGTSGDRNAGVGTARILRRRGWESILYRDKGQSGSKQDRPALNELLADLRRRKIDVILVWSLDRLARSLKQLLTIADWRCCCITCG